MIAATLDEWEVLGFFWGGGERSENPAPENQLIGVALARDGLSAKATPIVSFL